MRWLGWVLLVALGCGRAPLAAQAPGGPRLVVLIVIDQLPSWSFAGREQLLDRGLGRLLREGTVFPQARYPFAATFTAPGHAALGTGAPPAVTGIIANEWWDRGEQRPVDSTDDSGYPLLVVNGWPGELAAARASPWRLRVDGIGDALRAASHGAGRAVGVSLKGRAAMFATGRHADLAVWYDDSQRAFTTSSWYRARLPEWLVRLAHEHPIAPRLLDDWEPLDPALLARATGLPDDAPGEGGGSPFGATFPHRPRLTTDAAATLKLTPLGATVVREAALAAVDGEGLGRGAAPDLLVVSFSSYDYVAHSFGQESWEALDTLLRLDREIAELVDGLEARVGAGRVAVVVTSDHGAVRMVERSRAAGRAATRVDVADVRRAAEQALASILGPGPWLAFWREPTLYLAPRFAARSADERDRALDAAVAAVARVDGIGYAVRKDRVAGSCADAEGSLCRALDVERSGEILFGPRPDSMILDKDQDPIAHGSANDDDTTVPIIVWGPGIAPARIASTVSTLQVAATLAELLGVPPPAAATAPPLPVARAALR
jgi:hypothetical protein